jgi:hypothetical protein
MVVGPSCAITITPLETVSTLAAHSEQMVRWHDVGNSSAGLDSVRMRVVCPAPRSFQRFLQFLAKASYNGCFATAHKAAGRLAVVVNGTGWAASGDSHFSGVATLLAHVRVMSLAA